MVRGTLLKSISCTVFLLASGCLKPSHSTGRRSSTSDSQPATQLTLAQRVKQILQNRCYSCHGQNGSNQGGFGYALDYRQLIGSRKVIPFDPQKSLLLTRTDKGGMPPGGSIPQEEIDTFRSWIEQGAPDFNARGLDAIVALKDVHSAILKDLQNLGVVDPKIVRYLSLVNLYNNGAEDKQLEAVRQGVSKLINSLSLESVIVPPQPIDEKKLILRIDLGHYKWNTTKWKQLIDFYPYTVFFESSEDFRKIVEMTGDQAPIIRADWFVGEASEPKAYHILLDLPAKLYDLMGYAGQGIDIAGSLKAPQGKVMRMGFYESGVSSNNRAADRFASTHGSFWLSYDFAGSVDEQNLFLNPFGPKSLFDADKLVEKPVGDKAFVADGGEVIFSLPNGLFGYFLTTGTGARLEEGPISIVSNSDYGKRYVAVRNGFSCFQCHHQGLLEKGDEIRDSILANSVYFSSAEHDLARNLFPESAAMQERIKEDNKKYRDALANAGVSNATDPIIETRIAYDASLSLGMAAMELDVSDVDLKKVLSENRTAFVALGVWDNSGLVKRDVIERIYGQLNKAIGNTRSVPAASLIATSPASGTQIPTNATISAVIVTASTSPATALAALNLSDIEFKLSDSDNQEVAGDVTLNSYTLTFKPKSALKPLSSFTASVTVKPTDPGTSTFDQVFRTQWAFKTSSSSDTTPPKLQTQFPKPGQLLNDPSVIIAVTFTEPIDLGSVNSKTLTLKSAKGDVPGNLELSQQGIRLIPSSILTKGEEYTVNLSTDLTDLAGNRLAAASEWKFTVLGEVTEPLKVVSVQPKDLAESVPVQSALRIEFSRPVIGSSVGFSTVRLVDSRGAVVSGQYLVNDAEVRFIPKISLRAYEKYHIQILKGVTDVANISLENDFSSSFTTVFEAARLFRRVPLSTDQPLPELKPATTTDTGLQTISPTTNQTTIKPTGG